MSVKSVKLIKIVSILDLHVVLRRLLHYLSLRYISLRIGPLHLLIPPSVVFVVLLLLFPAIVENSGDAYHAGDAVKADKPNAKVISYFGEIDAVVNTVMSVAESDICGAYIPELLFKHLIKVVVEESQFYYVMQHHDRITP